ncbi:MAG: hypothetical protein Kow00133_05350 [Amphiplicatus sp.]
MASGADLVIARAQVFDRLEEALADCSYVLATTARPREILLPVLSPEEAAAALKARIDAGARCAVMFGRERSGLLNDETARADAIVSIPVNPAFASLNLAQAVAVLAYEWAKADGRKGFSSSLQEAAPAPREALDGFLDQLVGALDAAGYFFPPEKRPAMERNLRAAFTRAGFTEGEVRTLRGVVKALAGRPRKQG